jgi:hypothetical protein
MDEINEIKSFSGLRYNIYKIFDTFWLINIDGDQNIKQKRTPLKIKSFLSSVVHLKMFGPF